MSTEEGSRGEFLKLLAELGEEPAFVTRARAPHTALESLLRRCTAKRQEMIHWPASHFATLAQRVGGRWSRLAPFFADSEYVSMLEALQDQLPPARTVAAPFLSTNKTLLGTFLDSAERFNRHWRNYLQAIDLGPVNQPRLDYNQYYVVEKACAFGFERVSEGFEPLSMIDYEFLEARFPLLQLPSRRS